MLHPGMVGTMARQRTGRGLWLRRALIALGVIVCAALTLFPERYRAAVTMTPTDPASLGLSGTLGQLGAMNTVFGNQAAVEIALKVARSVQVRSMVSERLGLMERMGLRSSVATDRWLRDKVRIRALRGGILVMEARDRDAEFAQSLVSVFSEAVRDRLADINERQTAYKRRVLLQLVRDASDRLAVAQAAYDNFRLRSRYANPELAIEAIGGQIPLLQQAIKAKEVQLNAARQFATDENMTVRQIEAEIGALQRQLAEARATNPRQSDSVGKLVQASTEAERLARELAIAQSLYDSYKRFLEGTIVEDLTSTASVRVLEPPFVDTARQFNLVPAAIGVTLLLIGLATEFYRMRPPAGDGRIIHGA